MAIKTTYKNLFKIFSDQIINKNNTAFFLFYIEIRMMR